MSDDIDIVASQTHQQISSVLFEGYRSLGYYSSDIPFSVVKSDEDVLIASSVGRHAFYVYDSKHLNLVYMSKYIDKEISWIEASPDGFIYTALGQQIICWKKMHRVSEFQGHNANIIKFIIAGDFIFSLAEGGEFIVFNRSKGSIVKKIQFEKEFDDFIHPTTYVNKLLFSGVDATQLWNIMSEEKIFDFGFGDATCFEQSPVVDIVAVGFANGEIRLINLLYNEVLLKFSQDGSKIKSLSFSSDTTLGVSILASVSESSEGGENIVFWDLNQKKILSTLQDAHSSKQVSCIHFMSGEPVLISSSEEGNSIKMWLFEKG